MPIAKKTYYYMTLNKDFFDYYKIKVLRGMPKGDGAVLLYIFLLLESLNWNGELRYDDKTAYTVDTLRNLYSSKQKPSSFRTMFLTLKNINLISVKEDGTIVVDTAPITIGKDTESAKYYRNWRFANANPTQTECKPNANRVQTQRKPIMKDLSNKSIEIREVETPSDVPSSVVDISTLF